MSERRKPSNAQADKSQELVLLAESESIEVSNLTKCNGSRKILTAHRVTKTNLRQTTARAISAVDGEPAAIRL